MASPLPIEWIVMTFQWDHSAKACGLGISNVLQHDPRALGRHQHCNQERMFWLKNSLVEVVVNRFLNNLQVLGSVFLGLTSFGEVSAMPWSPRPYSMHLDVVSNSAVFTVSKFTVLAQYDCSMLDAKNRPEEDSRESPQVRKWATVLILWPFPSILLWWIKDETRCLLCHLYVDTLTSLSLVRIHREMCVRALQWETLQLQGGLWHCVVSVLGWQCPSGFSWNGSMEWVYLKPPSNHCCRHAYYDKWPCIPW